MHDVELLTKAAWPSRRSPRFEVAALVLLGIFGPAPGCDSTPSTTNPDAGGAGGSAGRGGADAGLGGAGTAGRGELGGVAGAAGSAGSAGGSAEPGGRGAVGGELGAGGSAGGAGGRGGGPGTGGAGGMGGISPLGRGGGPGCWTPSAMCGAGSYCAHITNNGAVEVDQCVSFPRGCQACDCATVDLVARYQASFTPPRGYPPCVCGDGQGQIISGGAGPPAFISCAGA